MGYNHLVLLCTPHFNLCYLCFVICLKLLLILLVFNKLLTKVFLNYDLIP